MRLTDSLSDCTTFHVNDELKAALAKFESSGDRRLSIELVPKSSHFENLRNHIKPSDWTRLRKAVAEKARARATSVAVAGETDPLVREIGWLRGPPQPPRGPSRIARRSSAKGDALVALAASL